MKKLPEINFATANVEELITGCQKTIESELGRKLERADPIMLLLKSLLAIIVQQRLLIDEVAKMNLLAYSKGDYLEHLGELVGVERMPATAATTTMEIKLSAARATTTIITKGTRITADNKIFFALDEDVVIPAGEVTATCAATCSEVGEVGNNFAVDEINKIVDPQPFLLSITNTTTSAGGSDVESDDDLRERIRQAPESFSVAGSEGAYIFHAKSVSPLIKDVAIDSPEPGKVDVYVLLEGGELPGEEIINAVTEHLNAKTIRPLTDLVTVKAPTVEEYELDLTYYISRADAVFVSTIAAAAESAVEEYVKWQENKLGRDLNPSELIYRLKEAGMKRVEVRSPSFKATDAYTVAKVSTRRVVFGGLEDD